MNRRLLSIAILGLAGVTGQAMADDKVTICHKGVQTASVAAQAVSAHQAHGDTLGACDGTGPVPQTTMAAVVMMRCAADGGTVDVVAVSASPAPAIEGGIDVGDDCAAALGELIDAGYGLRSITSGSSGTDSLQLVTDYLLLGRAPVPAAD